TTYVKSIKGLGWEIMQGINQKKLSKNQKIVTISIENSLKDVLTFFDQNELVPFCPIDKPTGMEFNRYLVNKNINRRKYPRKKVTLNGDFFNIRTKHRGGFRTRDISLRGIKFTPKSSHDIVLGDNLMVNYVLRNSNKSNIIREIKTKYINEKLVGAEIITPPPLDPDLGFYLME
ncbi:MAG: PilZ domain-containing protein, partial [Desulfobacteraceae bacterium]|nr:PilZ domain-containing protein [Desulfobacteraceae bacterium]